MICMSIRIEEDHNNLINLRHHSNIKENLMKWTKLIIKIWSKQNNLIIGNSINMLTAKKSKEGKKD